MGDRPPPLSEAHRRKLSAFARWLAATMDAPEAHRETIVALARRVAADGHGKSDRLGTLDALDEALSDVWDRRLDDGRRP